MKSLAIVFILFLLLSCSSENGTKQELTNPVMENEVNEDPTQRDRTWDLHVVDSDGWDIYLNSQNAYFGDTKYSGVLEWIRYGILYSGDAWAYYNQTTDVFTVSCIDAYQDKVLTYSFVFDSNDNMSGCYFYESLLYTYHIYGSIESGNIGSHSQPTNRNTSSHEFSVKAQRTEE
jgi:hypothetical protein